MRVLYHNEKGYRREGRFLEEGHGRVWVRNAAGGTVEVRAKDVIGRADTYAGLVLIAQAHVQSGCESCNRENPMITTSVANRSQDMSEQKSVIVLWDKEASSSTRVCDPAPHAVFSSRAKLDAYFAAYGSVAQACARRFTVHETRLDPTPPADTLGTPYAVDWQPDGKILIVPLPFPASAAGRIAGGGDAWVVWADDECQALSRAAAMRATK